MYKKWFLFSLVLFTIVLSSCSKDPDDNPSVPELPSPEPFTEEEQQQMSNALETAFNAYMGVYETQGPVAAATAAVHAASQLPGVETCAASENGYTVWLGYTCGVISCVGPLTYKDSLPPELNMTGQNIKDASDISHFPEGTGNAVMLCSDDGPKITTVGNCFIPRLQGVGYTLDNTTYRGLNFNPVTLYHVSQESEIILIVAHGTLLDEALPDFGGWVGIVTSIPWTPENVNEYSALLRRGDITYMKFSDGTISLIILPKFVRDYCSFSSDAFIFGNFCYSASESSDWGDAILSKNAAVFMGWDDAAATGAAFVAGNSLADLLTGNRSEDTELGGISLQMMKGITLPLGVMGPDLPVNIGNAELILEELKIPEQYNNIANLVVYGDRQWGLRPHLDNYTVSGNEITLSGSFGPEEGEVRIEDGSGTNLASLFVISWSESEIRCRKPEEDPYGKLVVYAGGIKSNPQDYGSGPWVLNWGNSGIRYFEYLGWPSSTAVMSTDGQLGIVFNASSDPGATVTVENITSISLGTPVECSMFISYGVEYANSPFAFSDSDPWLRTYVTFTQKDLTFMGIISGNFSGKLGIYHPMDPYNWETVEIISAPFTVTYLGQGK